MASLFKKTIFFLILFFVFSSSILTLRAQQPVLEKYIKQAIESNVALKQKQLSYEKSLYTLKEARRKFFPTISVVAEYSFNEGGRVISMPFGDMLNPVYENLNLINQINSSQNPNYPDLSEYPSLENTEMPLNPDEQQITMLKLEMPIFNAALLYNQNIQKQISEIEAISAEVFKKELIKEVKITYMEYNVVLKKIDITKKAAELVSTNLDVSNSLFKNDKITIDEVFKAEAKVKEVESSIVELEKAEILNKAYFNFLLNRKYNEEIEIEGSPIELAYPMQGIDELIGLAQSNREELKLQDRSILINETQIKLQKSGALPIIQLEANAGYWSEDYTFSNETDYTNLAFSMKWELFTSGQRKSKIQQAKVDNLIAIEKKKELENNITLEVIEAYQNLKSAKETIELSELKMKSYKESFKIIEKKKEQSKASQLEYDVAFTDYYDSEITLLNNQNLFYQKIIELEYSINK